MPAWILIQTTKEPFQETARDAALSPGSWSLCPLIHTGKSSCEHCKGTRAIPPTAVLNTSSHRLFLTRMSTDDGAARVEKWGVGILETSLMRSWMMTFCGRVFVRGCVLGHCQVNFSQVSHHIRGPPQHRHARDVVLHPVLEVARVRGLRASGVTFATMECIFNCQLTCKIFPMHCRNTPMCTLHSGVSRERSEAIFLMPSIPSVPLNWMRLLYTWAG